MIANLQSLSTMPPELDDLLLQPVRLRIMLALAVLDAGAVLEFTALRNQLELTDGNLGAHLRKLAAAGYVLLVKSFVANKPHTQAALTPAGRQALAQHVEALRALVDDGTKER